MLKDVLPHGIQVFVVNFKQVFDASLLFGNIHYESLLLDFIVLFEFCDARLDIFYDFTQYDVLLTLVLRKAPDAVEVATYTIAKIDFNCRMSTTEKLFGVEFERAASVRSFIRLSRYKLFEFGSCCRVLIEVFLHVCVDLWLAWLVYF